MNRFFHRSATTDMSGSRCPTRINCIITIFSDCEKTPIFFGRVWFVGDSLILPVTDKYTFLQVMEFTEFIAEL